jgi:DNA-directed RNA polymerase subunit RPC12/RpoP
MFICTCDKCGEIFKAEDSGRMPGSKEKEPINCPFCGEHNGDHMVNGVWRCSKLLPEEEKRYKKEK